MERNKQKRARKKNLVVREDSSPTPSRRQTVGMQEDFDFTTAIRKAPQKAPAGPGYIYNKKRAKKRKSNKKRFFSVNVNNINYLNFLMYASWSFCFFLLMRLVFVDKGVVDFYQRLNKLQESKQRISLIKRDTETLKLQIAMIKTDVRFQKKLVRDHLGFISKDEYLILFPQVSSFQEDEKKSI